jgi:hypothetical protein
MFRKFLKIEKISLISIINLTGFYCSIVVSESNIIKTTYLSL